jgi:trehalose 6-phosphate phosphatase
MPTAWCGTARSAASGRTRWLTDFDGTLAPITAEPGTAHILPLARRALRRLAAIAEARPGRLELVVLSGRTAADLADQVRVGGVRYLGDHGVQTGRLARRARPGRLSATTDPALARWIPVATELGWAVAARLGAPRWLFVESKGASVAFHFRSAPDPGAARLALVTAIAELSAARDGDALAWFEGRRVIECRPLTAGGKGEAAARLVERHRPGAILVLGDDVSDAAAFRAVAAARADRAARALIVGVHAEAGTPAEVAAAADVVLDGPDDAARLLWALARELDRELDREPARERRRD